MDPPIIYSLIFTIHLSFLRPINSNYPWFSFNYISYSANNTGERCVLVIYIHKFKCNSLIFILLLFFYCIEKIFRAKKLIVFIVLHFVKFFCDIGQFLLNTVIIVTSFVLGQHHVFVIAIVTCECAILIPRKIRFGVCHRYLYT